MRSLFLIILFMTLNGCGPLGALFRSTDHFVRLESDPRILYEPGAKELAIQVSIYLDDSISKVGQAQYRDFAKPVAIHICGSEKSFARHTGLSPKIKAAVFNGRLFLSAALLEQPQRIPTLTTHELSHLHFVQLIGTSKYVRNIPSWFAEGLAVHVSHGGGAEKVDETVAADAIMKGSHFHPEKTGSILFPKTASSYGLKPHMFYRQSGMFVKYLKENNAEKFKILVTHLQSGEKFDTAFNASFEERLDVFWHKFKEHIGSISVTLM